MAITTTADFYQKVFETIIDQLNFMNLVDGEIDSDLHTFA